MNYKDIRVGDVVELNSGSPDMTVSALHKEESPRNVECMWFNERTETITVASFPAASLRQLERLVDEDEKNKHAQHN